MQDCGIHAHEHLAALQPELVASLYPRLLQHVINHQDNTLMHHGCGFHLSLTAVAARLPPRLRNATAVRDLRALFCAAMLAVAQDAATEPGRYSTSRQDVVHASTTADTHKVC